MTRCATSASVSREAVRAAQAGNCEQQAALESDLAAIDRAKLDLSYCQISPRSPAGREPSGACRKPGEGK